MSAIALLFYVFEGVAALAALSLLFVRNVFYGALLLMICLLAIAAIYILSFAEVVAVTQVLIYAGGILVVIIFGIMLTSKLAGKPLVVTHANTFLATLGGGALFLLFVYLIKQTVLPVADNSSVLAEKNVEKVGLSIMTDFVLPFEIAGILLLAALVGAAVLASVLNTKES